MSDLDAEQIFEEHQDDIHNALAMLQELCFARSHAAGWWNDEQGVPLDRESGSVRGMKLALVHSEISEALEGERTGLPDDKLAHRPMAEVELADAIIRIFDYAGACQYDIAGALFEKLAYNTVRADHKPAARALAGGKKF